MTGEEEEEEDGSVHVLAAKFRVGCYVLVHKHWSINLQN